MLDPWWNPAVEAQAVDRTHRIGQDKTVMVYRLVAVDTIEEKVMELKARKQDLFDKVMDDDCAAVSAAHRRRRQGALRTLISRRVSHTQGVSSRPWRCSVW